MMKTIMLLYGLLLSSSAMAADGALASVDSSRIRTIALASIAEKYPEISSSKLVFDSIQYSLSASNTEVIAVTYQLPSSTETKDQKTEVPMIRTKTETISVRMSILGKVQNVSKGSSMRISTTPQLPTGCLNEMKATTPPPHALRARQSRTVAIQALQGGRVDGD